MVESPFQVVEPSTGESPLLVEVPHAGLCLDPESLAWTVAPASSIGRDADLYVDELFQDAPAEGATLVRANTSRYVVDLNRAESDVDADTVEGGGSTPCPRGLIWRLTTDGDPVVAARLPRSELERRLTSVYRPYHAVVDAVLQRKRARFGFAILLCAHSMPSQGRRGHADGGAAGAGSSGPGRQGPHTPGLAGGRDAGAARPGNMRADLVPGTRGRTTAAGALIDLVDRHARERGWSVRHDDPYRGGFSTAHYGRPDLDVHAIQIEIARRLYMDEPSLRRDDAGFAGARDFARTLCRRLGQADRAALQAAPRRDLAL